MKEQNLDTLRKSIKQDLNSVANIKLFQQSSPKINGWGEQEAAYRANLMVEGSTGEGVKAEMQTRAELR